MQHSLLTPRLTITTINHKHKKLKNEVIYVVLGALYSEPHACFSYVAIMYQMKSGGMEGATIDLYTNHAKFIFPKVFT